MGLCEIGVGVPEEVGNDGYAGVIGGGDTRPASSPNGRVSGVGAPDLGVLGRDWDCCIAIDGRVNPLPPTGGVCCCGSRSLMKAGFKNAIEER
jgi:hypothetical protein